MSAAFAHDLGVSPPADALGWSFEAWAIIPLIVMAWLYWRGRQATRGHADRPSTHVRFWAGIVITGLAVMSPLHAYGERLFSVHMVEHEILMVLCAPLLVSARPGGRLLAGLPAWAKPDVVGFIRLRSVRKLWSVATELWSATLIHAVVIWAWHVPVLFQAALDYEGLHILQHLSFILSACLFWEAIISRDQRRFGQGIAALALFITSLQTSVLGALITFATRLWYPAVADPFPIIGLSRSEDQALAGLIMWVPACTIYVIAALAVLARWLTRTEARPG